MTIIDRQFNKLSNLVVREQWESINYCRADVEVNLTLSGAGTQPIQFGEVVIRASTAAEGDSFIRLAQATVIPASFTAAIIVDDRIKDVTILNGQPTQGWGLLTGAQKLGQAAVNWELSSTDVISLACIVRGDCVIREGGLRYGSVNVSEGNRARILTQLRAQDITITTRMQGDFLQPLPYKN